jgi:phosphoglucomutase
MTVHARAGYPAPAESLIDVDALRTAYYSRTPDLSDRAQRIVFGTGGHRGSALRGAFNEAHVRAITQAICDYRHQHAVGGPLFLGRDTHALSEPAFATVLEVLTTNRVHAMLEANGGCTPAPAVSRAILTHNRISSCVVADGIVVTASQNPPAYGGVRYSPPTGGPADASAVRWIEGRANRLLSAERGALSRLTYARARRPNSTQVYDYIGSYVRGLADVVDMEAIRHSGLRIGVDPLGGVAGAVWTEIADRYGIAVELVNGTVDPTFRFMPLDWDGQIRMDCASPYSMATIIGLRDRFDIAFGNDPDADRHGIVTRAAGLMNPNHYIVTAVAYLFAHRPAWAETAAIGKTAVSSALIDRVAASLGRRVIEVPVAFRWFVPGLLAGSLGFAGDESAGASFLQRDGAPWTTDRDGIVMDLLAVEMMARTGRDPSELYAAVTDEFGMAVYERIEISASPEEQALLASLPAGEINVARLAGDRVVEISTVASGNHAPLGGVKVATEHGWFAARPSGTEGAFTLHAESLKSAEHLVRVQTEARAILSRALAGVMR